MNTTTKPRVRSGSIYEGVPVQGDMTARDWAAREIYTSELQYLKHLDSMVLVNN